MNVLLQQGKNFVANPVARDIQARIGLVGSIVLTTGGEVLKKLRPRPAQEGPQQASPASGVLQGSNSRDPCQAGDPRTSTEAQQDWFLLVLQ